jgi:hypothetical protein
LKVTEKLLASTQGGLQAAQEVLPHAVAQQILEALYNVLKQEPTVVDVRVEELFDGCLQAHAVCFHSNHLPVCRWHQQHQTSLSWYLAIHMDSSMMSAPCMYSITCSGMLLMAAYLAAALCCCF